MGEADGVCRSSQIVATIELKDTTSQIGHTLQLLIDAAQC